MFVLRLFACLMVVSLAPNLWAQIDCSDKDQVLQGEGPSELKEAYFKLADLTYSSDPKWRNDHSAQSATNNIILKRYRKNPSTERMLNNTPLGMCFVKMQRKLNNFLKMAEVLDECSKQATDATEQMENRALSARFLDAAGNVEVRTVTCGDISLMPRVMDELEDVMADVGEYLLSSGFKEDLILQSLKNGILSYIDIVKKYTDKNMEAADVVKDVCGDLCDGPTRNELLEFTNQEMLKSAKVPKISLADVRETINEHITKMNLKLREVEKYAFPDVGVTYDEIKFTPEAAEKFQEYAALYAQAASDPVGGVLMVTDAVKNQIGQIQKKGDAWAMNFINKYVRGKSEDIKFSRHRSLFVDDNKIIKNGIDEALARIKNQSQQLLTLDQKTSDARASMAREDFPIIKRDIARLLKTNPAAAGQILLAKPEYSAVACTAVKTIAKNDASDEKWNKAFAIGGMIVGGTLIVSGVGAAGACYLGLVGNAAAGTFGLALLNTSMAFGAASTAYYVSDALNYRPEQQAFLDALITKNSDANSLMEARDARDRYEESRFAAALSGIGMVLDGVALGVAKKEAELWLQSEKMAKSVGVGQSVFTNNSAFVKKYAEGILKLSKSIENLPEAKTFLKGLQKILTQDELAKFLTMFTTMDAESIPKIMNALSMMNPKDIAAVIRLEPGKLKTTMSFMAELDGASLKLFKKLLAEAKDVNQELPEIYNKVFSVAKLPENVKADLLAKIDDAFLLKHSTAGSAEGRAADWHTTKDLDIRGRSPEMAQPVKRDAAKQVLDEYAKSRGPLIPKDTPDDTAIRKFMDAFAVDEKGKVKQTISQLNIEYGAMPEGDSFFIHVEDPVLKYKNDKIMQSIGGKEYNTAIENFKQLVLTEEIAKRPELAKIVRGVQYSDYKSYRFAVSADGVDPIKLKQMIEEVITSTGERLRTELLSHGIVDSTLSKASKQLAKDPRDWLLTGIGRSKDEAALAARQLRETAAQTGRRVGLFSDHVDELKKILRSVRSLNDDLKKMAKKIIKPGKNADPDFYKTMGGLLSGNEENIFSADAYAILRKFEGREDNDFLALAKMFDEHFNTKLATDFDKGGLDFLKKAKEYFDKVDQLSPAVYSDARQSFDWDFATEGAITFDLKGLGANNHYQTERSLMRALKGGGDVDLNKTIELVRKGENFVTKEMKDVLEKLETACKRNGLEFRVSGDDILVRPKKEIRGALTDAEKADIREIIRSSDAAKDVRGVSVPSASAMKDGKMSRGVMAELSLFGETIEKKMRTTLIAKGIINNSEYKSLEMFIDITKAAGQARTGKFNIYISGVDKGRAAKIMDGIRDNMGALLKEIGDDIRKTDPKFQNLDLKFVNIKYEEDVLKLRHQFVKPVIINPDSTADDGNRNLQD